MLKTKWRSSESRALGKKKSKHKPRFPFIGQKIELKIYARSPQSPTKAHTTKEFFLSFLGVYREDLAEVVVVR